MLAVLGIGDPARRRDRRIELGVVARQLDPLENRVLVETFEGTISC